MICKQCENIGLKSTITIGEGSQTSLYCPPYYDEDGVYHNHDYNEINYTHTCSNGHKFVISKRKGCPAPNCDFVEQTSEQLAVTNIRLQSVSYAGNNSHS